MDDPEIRTTLQVEAPRSMVQELEDIARREGVRLELLVTLALADFLRQRRGDRQVVWASAPHSLAQYSVAERAPWSSVIDDGEAVERRMARSKYAALYGHLRDVPAERSRLELSMAEIEEILGAALPPAARRNRPWWANTRGSHVQAFAWLEAGWEVDGVDLNSEKVRFRRQFRR